MIITIVKGLLQHFSEYKDFDNYTDFLQAKEDNVLHWRIIAF